MASSNAATILTRRESLSELVGVGLSLFALPSVGRTDASQKKHGNYSQISSDRRLILCGGGNRPDKALSTFIDFARESTAKNDKSDTRILVIGWGKQDPARFFPSFEDQISKFKGCVTRLAPSRDEILAESSKAREDLINDLRLADGVFFLGGNQLGIMKAIDSHVSIRDEFRAFFESGRIVGGTSAGTAIMSHPMINGHVPIKGDFSTDIALNPIGETRICHGLGFCPDGIIVDQHGYSPTIAGRAERLHSVAKLTNSQVGILVGENGAASLVSTSNGEIKLLVLGGQVGLSLRSEKDGDYHRTILKEGHSINLEGLIQRSQSLAKISQ